MEFIFGFLIIGFCLYFYINKGINIKDDDKKYTYKGGFFDTQEKTYYLPYKVRSTMMTSREKILFDVLRRVIGSNYDIYPQVKFDKIFYVNQPRYSKYYMQNFRRISQKSVDYLVVSPMTQKPLFAIELDDSTHEKQDRMERDAFTEQLFKTANFPLIRFNADSYNENDLRIIFGKYLNINSV